MTKIWIDADACPRMIKEVLYDVSFRLKLPVCLVANSQMHIPPSPFISLVQVAHGADVADQHIVQHALPGDLVITADIPLADLVVKKGVTAINPRGEVYTEDNISERLSMRDFMKELRDSGVVTGGPEALGPKDKVEFTNNLNRVLTKLLRR